MKADLPIFLSLILACSALAEQKADYVPPAMQGVGIIEKLADNVPQDLRFVDEKGQAVTLQQYFDLGRPVVLTLNYYGCPSLCTVQLNGLIQTLKPMDWLPGQKFEIVTISFNPEETWKLARDKKASYMVSLEKPQAEAGWHFLTGQPDEIKRITEAAGFKYKWDPDTKQFVHAAALIICTPEGKIARYLPGVQYEPRDLRLALLEASQGKIGSLADQFYMLCYHYDPTRGTYAPTAAVLMKLGGVIVILCLGVFLGSMWVYERRKKAKQT